MKRLKPLPVLVPVAAICLGLLAGEGWLLQRSRLETARVLTTLKQKREERDRLARQSPALNPENEAAVSADLIAAGRSLAVCRSGLQEEGTSLWAAPAPDRSIDALFELNDFIAQLRAKAGKTQVALKPDERFGFASHANEGPALEYITVVHRQRLGAQYILEALLESHPLALLSMRRERPGMESARELRNRADDFFDLDRTKSVRQLGLIESEAFHVEFTGHTETVRQFLNNLVTSRQPVVVRSVEVETLVAENSARRKTSALTSDAPVPLVKPEILKFGVTLEIAWLGTNPTTVP